MFQSPKPPPPRPQEQGGNCQNCGAHSYVMRRDRLVCNYCGTVQGAASGELRERPSTRYDEILR